MIKFCTCVQAAQDKMYGKQMRVYNKTEKKVGEQYMYRCTGCGKEQTRK